MKTRKTSLIRIPLLLVLILFIGELQLTGMTTNKKIDDKPAKPKKDEYQGKGTRAYNKAHPIQPKPKSQQINQKIIPRERIQSNPAPILPLVPVKTQQEQIEENQQQMLQQLLPQKNPNNKP